MARSKKLKPPEAHPSDRAFTEWRMFLKDKPLLWSERKDPLRAAFQAGWDRGLYEWRAAP